jgi:hypothetical protein
MFRRHRDIIETPLSERGYSLMDYADLGPGRGMAFKIALG